jgi:hypothetical protein
MKIPTISTFSVVVLLMMATNAKSQNYTFTASTGTYTELIGDSLLNDTATTWDDAGYYCPIGFSFKYNGTTYDSLYVGDSFIAFDKYATKDFYAFGADLADVGLVDSSGVSKSNISCLRTGAIGSRILKIQWQNAGFYGGPDSNYVNFQLLLYETSNKLEVKIGDNNITNSDASYYGLSGPVIGIIIFNSTFTSMVYSYLLSGNTASPTSATWNNINNNPPALSGAPSNGQIYTFIPGSSAIDEQVNNLNVALYPNPVNDFLYVDLAAISENVNVKIDISDISGRLLLSETNIYSDLKRIDFERFEKGTYIITITTPVISISKRFIKL